MARFEKISTLRIGSHVFHFSEPQIIEWGKDGEMRAILRIQHEEDIPKSCDCDRTVIHDCVCPQCRKRFIESQKQTGEMK